MGTVTLNAKLLQQLIAMRDTVLRSIFLDLRKAYDDLDRDRCLDILAGYGGSQDAPHSADILGASPDGG